MLRALLPLINNFVNNQSGLGNLHQIEFALEQQLPVMAVLIET